MKVRFFFFASTAVLGALLPALAIVAKPITITCPVVQNKSLISGSILHDQGHQWRVQLFNYEENPIPAKPVAQTKEYNSAKKNARQKKPIISCANPAPTSTEGGQCRVTLTPPKASASPPPKKQRNSVVVNTKTDLTYSCSIPLIRSNPVYCQGFVKPKVSSGQIRLSVTQIESEVHYKFFLVAPSGLRCSKCTNTTLQCESTQ